MRIKYFTDRVNSIMVNNHHPSKLMKDMAPMLDPDEDYITIAETEQQTAATKAQRKKELEDMHAHLKGKITLRLPQSVCHC